MLRPAVRARGVSMIEMMISLAIVAGMLGMAAPSLGTWLRNGQIRTAAEAILNGLQLARASAVQRNAPVGFYLTTTLDNGCAVSAAGTNWVVSMDDPGGACATPVSDTVAPRIVATRAGIDGSRHAIVSAEQAAIGFNGLGRRINAGSAASVSIEVSSPAGGSCAADGGDMRCLRVSVSAGGQVRMCDPAVAAGDVRSC